ncbi:MAG: integrase arm-type DNA-binding domain-containing protein [Wenzhouxiangellaceae bacterium]
MRTRVRLPPPPPDPRKGRQQCRPFFISARVEPAFRVWPHSCGVHPDVSLKDARGRRDEARKLLANDIDPSEHRRANVAAVARASRSSSWGRGSFIDTNSRNMAPEYRGFVSKDSPPHASPDHLAAQKRRTIICGEPTCMAVGTARNRRE